MTRSMAAKYKYASHIAITFFSFFLVATHIAGCGFHLRGKDDIPDGMSRMYISGARSNGLVRKFAEQLSFYGGQVTRSPQQAQVIMTVIDEDMEKRELSIRDDGKANEFELIYNLMYSLKTSYGETILPLQEMEVRRDYYNPQVNVVGKNEEENTLKEDIYEEAVMAVMRRAHVVLKNHPVEVPTAPEQTAPAEPVPAIGPDIGVDTPRQVTTVPSIGNQNRKAEAEFIKPTEQEETSAADAEATPTIEMPDPTSEPTDSDLQRRLEILKQFRDQGLITEEIYQERVRKVLREGI